MQFRVYLTATATFSIDVEAPDEDSAIDEAFDNVPDGLCAYCSTQQKIDLGEWEFEEADEL